MRMLDPLPRKPYAHTHVILCVYGPLIYLLGGRGMDANSESLLLHSSKWKKKVLSYSCHYNYVTPWSLTPDQGFPSFYCSVDFAIWTLVSRLSARAVWGAAALAESSTDMVPALIEHTIWEGTSVLTDPGYPGDICWISAGHLSSGSHQ